MRTTLEFQMDMTKSNSAQRALVERVAGYGVMAFGDGSRDLAEGWAEFRRLMACSGLAASKTDLVNVLARCSRIAHEAGDKAGYARFWEMRKIAFNSTEDDDFTK